MDNKAHVPSSSTTGFFQVLPILPPQYAPSGSSQPRLLQDCRGILFSSDDKALDRILNIYLPPHTDRVFDHVRRIARIALNPTVLKHSTDAETNRPTLRPLTTFGEENRNDPLWTTNGWQELKNIGVTEGVVAVAYEMQNMSWNRRVHEFALGHLWVSTASMTGCPMAMTDGAATLLLKRLVDEDGDQPGRQKVFKEAYRRLTSRNPEIAWTSGQWMTERTGGSDISGTETVARRLTNEEIATSAKEDAIGLPLGPWRIDGFKWFSSAVDSDMSILIARTSKGGLSAFYAPIRRRISISSGSLDGIGDLSPQTELNGIRIQRLKNKLGTNSLPTAELELKGTRAWLIGTEGQGIKEISAILNITRLHTAASSAGNWARGLAIARAYSRVRRVQGRLLQDYPQHLRWMADETVKYWAGVHFAFFGVALQGASEQNWEDVVKNTRADGLIPKEKRIAQDLLRLLTPVMKAQVSVASVNGLRQCMECLGGVGYCENNEDGGLMNIAKIYRDNLVNPIWEGTVSVMVDDVVRVLVDKRLGSGNIMANIFVPWVRAVLNSCAGGFEEEKKIVEERLENLVGLTKSGKREELLYYGRTILEHIEAVACSCLLIYDATISRNDVVVGIASQWAQSKALAKHSTQNARPWMEQVLMDRKIFLGDQSFPLQSQVKL